MVYTLVPQWDGKPTDVDPESPEWRLLLENFTPLRHDEEELKKMPKKIRKYYEQQDELISAFEELEVDDTDEKDKAEKIAKTRRLATIMAQVSFMLNVGLLAAKILAAYLSGSLAIIAVVVDSAVDLISGALMWWSSHAMKHRDIYKYPQGRTKLEPIAIVMVALIMSLASVQVMWESVDEIMAYIEGTGVPPTFGIDTISICVLTVTVKMILYILCKRVDNPTTQTLAVDHRNDVLSNAGALVCGYVGAQWWEYSDPIGAIVISIYIIGSWIITGWEQIRMLTGHSALPSFLKKITWLAMNHHYKIKAIETVRVYHFGNNFLAEVDIVLPEDMAVKEAHDIGETLQQRLESLEEIERAYVHIDYETEHKPEHEHKIV